MREQDFRQSLKKRGKKDHVVDNLVSQVAHFEKYLKSNHRKTLEDVTEEDLTAYLSTIDPKETKHRMRGIAIYYSFIGKGKTAAFARDIRQQLTAATQRVFKLRDFRGVNLRYLTLLDRAGIRNVKDILESGSTASERRELAQKTGVPEDAILEFVKLADLSRLDGVKGIRARLYYSAGVDTVEKLSSWDPDELLAMLRDFVTNTGFKGIAPLPKEVHETIARAKELPRIVQYD